MITATKQAFSEQHDPVSATTWFREIGNEKKYLERSRGNL